MSELEVERAGGLVTRALDAACRALALAGGAILACLALMVVASVAGRASGRPIQGDYELLQVGCAVALSFFLPYCQWRRGNISVDFFTARIGPRIQKTLDAVGAALLSLVLAVLAWRTGVGAIGVKAANEVSMIMGVPLWYAYALMAPAFALAALAGLHTAIASWRAR